MKGRTSEEEDGWKRVNVKARARSWKRDVVRRVRARASHRLRFQTNTLPLMRDKYLTGYETRCLVFWYINRSTSQSYYIGKQHRPDFQYNNDKTRKEIVNILLIGCFLCLCNVRRD
jgi:hypothetical protein